MPTPERLVRRKAVQRVLEPGIRATLVRLARLLLPLSTSPSERIILSRLSASPVSAPSALEPGTESAKNALAAALALYDDAERLVNQYASRYYGGRHPKHHLWAEHNRFLFDECNPDDRVIDIGCGSSAYQSWIAKKVRRFVAVDVDPERVAIAKRNHPDSRVEYCVMDVTRDLPSGEFDIAICSHVLEHLDDPVSFLSKLSKVTERIIIKVPLQDSHWIKLTKKDLGLFWLDDRDHRREYTEEMLTEQLQLSGWRIEKMIRGFDLRATARSGAR